MEWKSLPLISRYKVLLDEFSTQLQIDNEALSSPRHWMADWTLKSNVEAQILTSQSIQPAIVIGIQFTLGHSHSVTKIG